MNIETAFSKYKYTFAETLTEFMKVNLISVRQLSKLSGVSQRTISGLRSGTLDDPKLSSIVAICDVINVSIDEMLQRDLEGIDETLLKNYHLLNARDKKIADAVLGSVPEE